MLFIFFIAYKCNEIFRVLNRYQGIVSNYSEVVVMRGIFRACLPYCSKRRTAVEETNRQDSFDASFVEKANEYARKNQLVSFDRLPWKKNYVGYLW